MNPHIEALKLSLQSNTIPVAKAVDAIDEDLIESFTQRLEHLSNTVYADIWKLNVNMALRISDLLDLRMQDVINKSEIHVLESKTANTRSSRSYRKIVLNATAQKIIAKRYRLYPQHTYLFQSTHHNARGALTRQSVWNAFSKCGKQLGLHVGTHSARKTLGAKLYKAGVALGTIQKLLKHSTEGMTLQYIGITQQSVDSCYRDYEVKL